MDFSKANRFPGKHLVKIGEPGLHNTDLEAFLLRARKEVLALCMLKTIFKGYSLP